MSRDSNNKDTSQNSDWLGSFYGGNRSLETSGSLQTRKREISSIDKKHSKDGKLANKKRDISATIYIIRLLMICILVLVGFFLLSKGVSLYEERMSLEKKSQALPVVMMEAQIPTTQFELDNTSLFFEKQCDEWQQELQEIRSINDLLKRENYEIALYKCNEMLIKNPANEVVLKMITDIYIDMGKYVEAINSTIRLLNIDNTSDDLKVKLIQSVFAHRDYTAVLQLTDWYYSNATFNPKIHLLLLDSQIELEKYEEAIITADRLLNSDVDVLHIYNQKIAALTKLEKYKEALDIYDNVYEQRYRDPSFYRGYAICFVKLNDVKKSVEVLGKAVNIFGREVVLSWLAAPEYDDQRNDTYFNMFVVRVGGQAVAQQMRNVMLERREQVVKMPDEVLNKPQENVLLLEEKDSQ